MVDNRTGAGGSIAADNVAKSTPDGYSVLLGSIGSHALVPHLYAKPPYNAFTDFETACWIGTQPNLLVCHPDFPHDTPQKLIAAAKAEPGKYSYGASGVGTSPSLTMELLKQKTGVDLTFISYRGAAAGGGRRAGRPPADVHRQHRFADAPGECRQAEGDRLHRRQALGRRAQHADLRRSRASPTSSSPRGRCGRCRPARRPRSRRSCAPRTEKALQAPDVIESMKAGGFEPGTMSVAEADAFIKTEYKRWGEVIRAAGIQPQ